MNEIYKISTAEAEALKTKQLAKNHFYNPIKDADGIYVISAEEYKSTDVQKTDLKFLKSKTKEVFKAPDYSKLIPTTEKDVIKR